MDKTREIVKEIIWELKRDIINDYEYRVIEWETNVTTETNEDIYRCENLIYERNKILYSCYEQNYTTMVTQRGALELYSDKETFLKTPIEDIIKEINAAYFYNVREED